MHVGFLLAALFIYGDRLTIVMGIEILWRWCQTVKYKPVPSVQKPMIFDFIFNFRTVCLSLLLPPVDGTISNVKVRIQIASQSCIFHLNFIRQIVSIHIV